MVTEELREDPKRKEEEGGLLKQMSSTDHGLHSFPEEKKKRKNR